MCRSYYFLHRRLKSLCPSAYLIVFKHKKILKYLFAGGLAAVANLSAVFLLTDVFRVWYLTSSITGFLLGLAVSFFLQKFWTFEDREIKKIKRQLPIYIFIMIINLFINTALTYFFVESFGFWYLAAQIVSGIIIAFFNFFLYKFVVFKPQ